MTKIQLNNSNQHFNPYRDKNKDQQYVLTNVALVMIVDLTIFIVETITKVMKPRLKKFYIFPQVYIWKT